MRDIRDVRIIEGLGRPTIMIDLVVLGSQVHSKRPTQLGLHAYIHKYFNGESQNKQLCNGKVDKIVLVSNHANLLISS